MLLCAESLAGTYAIAATLAALARPGDIVVLAGEMGAGKTAFAQGFGRALGVTEAITSPTFTLVHSYPLPDRRLTLHHADIYRLDRIGDIEDLALHELAEFGGIVLVEWGDVAGSVLGDHLVVRLSTDHDHDDLGGDAHDQEYVRGTTADSDGDEDFGLDSRRLIEVEASGESWAGRWGRVTSELAAYRC